MVDTLGLISGLTVHAANISERDGAQLLLAPLANIRTRMIKILADGGYRGDNMINWVKNNCNWVLEIVKRNELHKFVVLPKRWIVERTFSWLNKNRRLSKDYEQTTEASESMIYLCMIKLMLRRLTY